MTVLHIGRTVEVACYPTGRRGPCFERDCAFEATVLVEAACDGCTGMVFACERHVEEGMLRALARYLDAAAWERSGHRSVPA